MLSGNVNFARQPRRGSASRYVISLGLLVAIIGGVAWVVQYLPNMTRTKKDHQPASDKPLLVFLQKPAVKEADQPLEFEQGESGHFDFPFKNVAGADLEVLRYASACDCANVKACILPPDEHERVSKHFAEKPGEPLPYAKEPNWHELSKDETNAKSLAVKADEVGIIRVGWVARRSPGMPLNVNPTLFFRPAGDTTALKFASVRVPIMVRHAVQFYPPRVHVGVLVLEALAKGELKGEFDAWSSTRENLDLKLTTLAPDPLFVIETRPLSAQECADLEETLKSKKIDTRVRSGARVSVIVNDRKDGRQLELGSFYRPLLVHLKRHDAKASDAHEPRPDIKGPEIVGRVDGDVVIGSEDRKLRFPLFTSSVGSSRAIELIAPADMKLETFKHDPPWLEVKLTPDDTIMLQKRRIWRLQVTVPPDTPTVRSLEEPDAVVLRIVEPPERFVGIALSVSASLAWDMPFVIPPPRFVRIPVKGDVTAR